MLQHDKTIIHWLDYSSYEDLKFYEAGIQDCQPGYGYGPIIRDKYILHYILSGEGELHLDGQIIPIREKQAFIIPPGVLGYYQASTGNPWHYIWIQFHGPKAMEMLHKAGLDRTSPVFHPREFCPKIEACLEQIILDPSHEYACMGNLYELFQLLIDYSSNPPRLKHIPETSTGYVEAVMHYIAEKYSEPIHIQDIADFCGLDRSYLSKLFKEITGYSPQRYLLTYRIKKAKELLESTELSIQHVSYSVGYNDPLAFSKFFKQETGLSPTQYRNGR